MDKLDELLPTIKHIEYKKNVCSTEVYQMYSYLLRQCRHIRVQEFDSVVTLLSPDHSIYFSLRSIFIHVCVVLLLLDYRYFISIYVKTTEF